MIYLSIPEADRIDFLAIYSKDESDDLSSDQRRALKQLALKAKSEAIEKALLEKGNDCEKRNKK